MTFSSASMSAREVDVVVATAAGVTGLRAGVGWVTRCRAGAAGAATGGGRVAVVAPLAGAVAAAGGIVFGTTLRAIGRALGNGTFALVWPSAPLAFAWPSAALDLACPSAAGAGRPIASVRLTAKTVDRAAVDRAAVDRAVDRKAVARANRVTTFLRGE